MRLTTIFFLSVSVACQASGSAPTTETATKRVVTTTTMLRDLVEQLGGSAVEVTSLVGVGADPHVFQPKPGSARAVASSDLVVVSGLGLEGWIDDLVKNAGGARTVLNASRGVEPIRMESFKAGIDPHFWFDPSLWAIAATNVASELDRLFRDRSGVQNQIAARLTRYLSRLETLAEWTKTQLESVPENQRILITSHDAFNYFGRAFNLEVVGIQGLSTETEASQRDVVRVIDLVRERKIPALFVESSVNPALIKRVASETGAAVRGPLFSDSLGDTVGPARTYVGMITENVRRITEGLEGRFSPPSGQTVAEVK